MNDRDVEQPHEIGVSVQTDMFHPGVRDKTVGQGLEISRCSPGWPAAPFDISVPNLTPRAQSRFLSKVGDDTKQLSSERVVPRGQWTKMLQVWLIHGMRHLFSVECVDDNTWMIDESAENVLLPVGITPDKTEVVTETIHVCREWGLYKVAPLISTRRPSHQL